MPLRTCVLGLGLTATMLGLTTGCGGSSSKSEAIRATHATTTSVPSTGMQQAPAQPGEPSAKRPLRRAQLIAKADAICKRLNERVAAVSPSQGLGKTAPQIASYYRAALAELRKLTPPAAMASDWRMMLADIEPLPEEIIVMGRYTLDHDLASVARVEKKAASYQQQRFTIARRDGFTDCAEA